MRTPMNGVIGVTHLLLDSNLTSEQREYAETIKKSGESSLLSIDNILNISRVEANQSVFDDIDFDIRVVGEDVIDILIQAYRKDLELVGLVSASVPAVLRGDPGRLRQILTNLAGNAANHCSLLTRSWPTTPNVWSQEWTDTSQNR